MLLNLHLTCQIAVIRHLKHYPPAPTSKLPCMRLSSVTLPSAAGAPAPTSAAPGSAAFRAGGRAAGAGSGIRSPSAPLHQSDKSMVLRREEACGGPGIGEQPRWLSQLGPWSPRQSQGPTAEAATGLSPPCPPSAQPPNSLLCVPTNSELPVPVPLRRPGSPLCIPRVPSQRLLPSAQLRGPSVARGDRIPAGGVAR